MKDRVVQYPNRFKMIPVPGQADTYDMVAAPGMITEAGDPLNKANLLSDATATLLGLDGTDVTVDGALKYSAEHDVGRYNIYGLNLEAYYRGVSPYKRLMFLDGFMNSYMIDTTNTDGNVDTTNKKFIIPLASINIPNPAQDGEELQSNGKVAQVFKMARSGKLTEISTIFFRNATSATKNISAKLYATSGGIPTTLIETSATVVAVSSLTNTAQVTKSFVFSSVLSKDVSYAVVFEADAGSGTCYFYRATDFTGGKRYLWSGTAWTEATKYLVMSVNFNALDATYQTLEQNQGELFKIATLFVSQLTAGTSTIRYFIAVGTTGAESFIEMTKDPTYARAVAGGYTEYRYTYSSPTRVSRAKLKACLYAPSTNTCEIKCYGMVFR